MKTISARYYRDRCRLIEFVSYARLTYRHALALIEDIDRRNNDGLGQRGGKTNHTWLVSMFVQIKWLRLLLMLLSHVRSTEDKTSKKYH